MVQSRTAYVGSQSRAIAEGDYVGEFVISDYQKNICHDNLLLDGGAGGIARNSVLADGAGRFRGISFKEVRPGQVVKRGCIVRGPCEVSVVKLTFPTVSNAPDGPDAGVDNAAENAVATTALRAVLIADMKAVGIVLR